MSSENNPLMAVSDALAAAAERGGMSTVMVNARRRMPATGIVYAANLILTADHVIEREDDLQLTLPDGNNTAASIVGRDPGSDLAVLRVAVELQPAEPAPAAARVGQLVLALGRPSIDGIQASLGVVSAIGGPVRTGRGGLIEQYLRTDTTPFPGFSGGPLVDAAGRVLGLNTSGLAHGGMAVTIPTGLAWQAAEALARFGHVRRGYLGVRSQPAPITTVQRQALDREQETGLLLIGIESDGPAERAGLLVGDILIGVNGQTVTDPDELLSLLSGELIGKSAAVEVLRGGQPTSVQVTIGERK